TPPTGGAATRDPHWLVSLGQQEEKVRLGLLVLGVALAVVPFLVWYNFKFDRPVTFSWGVGLVVVTLGTAGLSALLATQPLNRTERARVLVLTLLGGYGLLTALLGILLPFYEYSTVFAGGIKEWRDKPGPLLWCLAAVVGGLVLMFLAVQATQGAERASPVMRRLLFGYNTVLGGLLLVLILGLFNVAVYLTAGPLAIFSRSFD